MTPQPRPDAAARAVSRDEQELVTRIRAGDASAFETVYRTHYRLLVGFVAGYLGSVAPAEEVVQDIFFGIWRQRTTWDLRTTVRAYLYQAARNRAISHLRHDGIARVAEASRTPEESVLAMGEPAPDPQRNAELDDLASAARRAIAELPPRCRMAFTLCRDHGLTYAEAARAMGISEHTVKVQMTRALNGIRTSLARWL